MKEMGRKVLAKYIKLVKLAETGASASVQSAYYVTKLPPKRKIPKRFLIYDRARRMYYLVYQNANGIWHGVQVGKRMPYMAKVGLQSMRSFMPLADFDNDRVPNALDCRPLDPFLQHTIDFPKTKGYDVRIAIYVPSTTNFTQPISPFEMKRRIQEVENFLLRTFGGYTRYQAFGGYMLEGKPVRESVVVIECYTTLKDYEKKDKLIEAFLKQKAREWGQESISYEFEILTEHDPREGIHFVEA